MNLSLYAEERLQPSVDPIYPFAIPAKSFDVSQMQKALAESLVTLVMGQSDQPVDGLGILAAEFRPRAIKALNDNEHPASQKNTDAFFINGFKDHLTATDVFTIFINGFLKDTRLESLRGIHLLEQAVFALYLFQTVHQGRIHAAEFGAPFMKTGPPHAVFPTQLQGHHSVLGFSDIRQDLAVEKA